MDFCFLWLWTGTASGLGFRGIGREGLGRVNGNCWSGRGLRRDWIVDIVGVFEDDDGLSASRKGKKRRVRWIECWDGRERPR